ncbi:hypothetical protein [Pontibacillus marinus]|uniref:SH3b domain-containing protein n=1 Tax=Pontibacillus marinus BH030004 = DSM 16465 TaxID=1385511 RepID=A0A0A5G6E8_9BACI|nr:hypothetical protein [Pontibacillus marinus]KGX86665.1 hypothetical protein N783_11760 [Pontibacillus marinus BH030004 = DSM 16465]
MLKKIISICLILFIFLVCSPVTNAEVDSVGKLTVKAETNVYFNSKDFPKSRTIQKGTTVKVLGVVYGEEHIWYNIGNFEVIKHSSNVEYESKYEAEKEKREQEELEREKMLDTIKEYKSLPTKINVGKDKVWSITFSTKLKESTINRDNFYVIDKNGIRHPESNGQLEYTTDGQTTVKFKPFVMGWMDKTHILVITSEVQSKDGIALSEGVKMEFTP